MDFFGALAIKRVAHGFAITKIKPNGLLMLTYVHPITRYKRYPLLNIPKGIMGDTSRWVFLALPLMVLCLLHKGQAIWLTVPPSGTKCVSEELHINVVVLADYYAVPDGQDHPNPTLSVKVSSPYGNTLHHKENMTQGQFSFTTTEAGNYLACFWVENGHNPGGRSLTVGLDWKTGIAAKDWESVARKEKIEGIELELRKLEGAVEAIHENLVYLKTREAEMRSVSELTNTRVASFSIASLAVCVLAAVLQILYLKRYFQKKKLI